VVHGFSVRCIKAWNDRTRGPITWRRKFPVPASEIGLPVRGGMTLPVMALFSTNPSDLESSSSVDARHATQFDWGCVPAQGGRNGVRKLMIRRRSPVGEEAVRWYEFLFSTVAGLLGC